MRCRLALVCVGLGAIGTGRLFAADGIKSPVESVRTERFPFAPNGTIRIDDSIGRLIITGWDEPSVEVTVRKSLGPDYTPSQQADAVQHLERVRITTDHRSDTNMVISTVLSPGGLFPPWPHKTAAGVLIDYDLHVPRGVQLTIHGSGYIEVSDVSGNIEATSRSGDIVLMLPGAGPYSIDARCRFGKVDSDYAGSARRSHLLGERFAQSSGSHHIFLRVGFGGITIKQLPSESEPHDPVLDR